MAELSDLLSPILIKELRQGRRSRALILLAVLTFAVAGLIFAFYATGARPSDRASSVFSALYGCLALVGFLIVPFMAHRSLVREQEAGSWQLLQLTGLGPRRIIAGKLQSALVQVGILSLAVAPFLILSQTQSALDVSDIALLCVAGAIVTGALTVVALFAATLPRSRSQRSLTQIALLLGLVLGVSGCLSIANGVGHRAISFEATLIALWAVPATSYTLFEAAAARLAMVAEDYAWRPRLALLVQLAGLTVLGLWHQSVEAFGIDGKTCHLVAVAIIACGALGMATEADRAGPPRRHGSLSSPFAPGALSGFRLTLVLLGLSTALWVTLLDASWAPLVVAAPAYLVLYLSAAIWMGRGIARRFRLATPDVTRVVFVVLSAVGALIPWVISIQTTFGPFNQVLPEVNSPGRFLPGYISPLYGLLTFNGEDRNAGSSSHAHWVLLALAVVVGVATERMLARRARLPSA